MDRAELLELGGDLDKFLGEFRGCFMTDQTAVHLGVYVRGQLGPLEWKSVEPIALDAGKAPRTLQEFLSLHRWDAGLMRSQVRKMVARDHASPEAIMVVDETSVAKKGEKTAGVQRQYCGSTGKVDNCVVSVHLGYVAGDFHALVDDDLYLPREKWIGDPQRRAEAGIPESADFRTKWQIALDLLDRTLADGVVARWLTADEGYGAVPAFLEGVAERKLLYVVEVPRSVEGWTPNGKRRGRKRRRVEKLWERGGPSWTTYLVKETGNGPLVWHARATRFHPSWDPSLELWLVVGRHALTGEIKYFLSNAPATEDVARLLSVAFSRWHIERIFEDSKQEVGLDHFEARKFRAIQRHFAVSMVSFFFLNRVRARARAARGGLEAIAILVAAQAGDRTSTRSDNLPGRARTQDPTRSPAHLLSPEERGAVACLAPEGDVPRATRRRDRSATGSAMSEAGVAL